MISEYYFTYVNNGFCHWRKTLLTSVFILILFTMVELYKQPQWLLRDEWSGGHMVHWLSVLVALAEDLYQSSQYQNGHLQPNGAPFAGNCMSSSVSSTYRLIGAAIHIHRQNNYTYNIKIFLKKEMNGISVQYSY